MMLRHLAGLLTFLLFRETFPPRLLSGQWLVVSPENRTPVLAGRQDYSYGDSSGFTPDSHFNPDDHPSETKCGSKPKAK